MLPIFALANAGVAMTAGVFGGPRRADGGDRGRADDRQTARRRRGVGARGPVKAAIKPTEYSWTQLAGAGALAGIGFTMSLFIAGQAFSAEADFEAAKVAILGASASCSLSA